MKKVNYIFLFVLVFICLHCKRTKIKENKKGFSDDPYIGVKVVDGQLVLPESHGIGLILNSEDKNLL